MSNGSQSIREPEILSSIWNAVGGDPALLENVSFEKAGALSSAFLVSDLASAVTGAAGLAISELSALQSGKFQPVRIDRRLASFWFQTSLRPQGWSLPALWDSVAGDYRAADGWIRLHTNAPHHRDAALSVLGTPADRPAVEQAVERWTVAALETAIVENGGCAASMRSIAEWDEHEQGCAVNSEPLLHKMQFVGAPTSQWLPAADRPLRGIKVLDLTRILAGPVATRFLAAFGADVLRIDPLDWDEPGTVPEVVLGKRCARLDLKTAEGRDTLSNLMAQADVIVHGYRPEALARLGFDPERRRQLSPGLIDVCLDAYGWTGPWRNRRGFDSLIQMSTGIAHAGMEAMQRDRPTPLPAQAVDHATGYLMATAVVRALVERLATGSVTEVRASLARTAQLLIGADKQLANATSFAAEQPADLSETIEETVWGSARRLSPPVSIEGVPMHWEVPASRLGTSPAAW